MRTTGARLAVWRPCSHGWLPGSARTFLRTTNISYHSPIGKNFKVVTPCVQLPCICYRISVASHSHLGPSRCDADCTTAPQAIGNYVIQVRTAIEASYPMNPKRLKGIVTCFKLQCMSTVCISNSRLWVVVSQQSWLSIAKRDSEDLHDGNQTSEIPPSCAHRKRLTF